MNRFLSFLKNMGITLLIIIAVYIANMIVTFGFELKGMTPMFFLIGVLGVSVCTEGYFYGILSALICTVLVNYAFKISGLHVEYEYSVLASAIVFFVIALVSCTMATVLQKARKAKAESTLERMKANLMRAMSHDLRTPLTSIYASSSAILDNFDDFTDEQRIELVKRIRTESHGLIRMAENLLSVTKVDSTNVRLNTSDTVLEELIDSIVVKYNRHFPEIPLKLEIPDEFVALPMDAMLIEQVLFNLLENAVRHAKGVTELLLRVTLEAKKVRFEVRDNGCGIPKDKIDKLFDKFFATQTGDDLANSRSMGIGLRVCDAIVKAHGGSITAKNLKEGGASFSFALDKGKNE
ncbi:MAG: PAS domain-containing sensor histidine kinase [Clostridia bacterium]|nr:PAS domain-containing sensor histidine kinase [Clostridia bacterium]